MNVNIISIIINFILFYIIYYFFYYLLIFIAICKIKSPGTEIGWHHGEAITENELRRISLCAEIGFELLSKRGNSG